MKKKKKMRKSSNLIARIVDEISRKSVALKVKMIIPEYMYRYVLELILQLIFVPIG